MRSASDAFARTVATSHTSVVDASILVDRTVVREGLAVIGGSVFYDRTASRLARATIDFAEPALIAPFTDELAPYGAEVLVRRGVMLPDGPEMVPLGVFAIQASEVDGVGLSTSVVARDRAQLVSDARFEDVYTIAAGTNYATAIEALISDGVDGLEFLFPSTSFTTPALTFFTEDDRWETAKEMSKSIGNEILFDGLGRCVMRPEPTFDDEASSTFAEGVNMVSVSAGLDRGPAFNKVIAYSSNASLDTQFRGEATDDDPASKSYYFGPFGRKQRFHASPLYASDAQCQAGAESILRANLGVAKSVSVDSWVDPRIEASDVVRVTRASLGLDELHIVDSLSIGLGPADGMSLRVRARPA